MLRHTTASDFIMKGGRDKTVADLLGTSVRMLDTTYAHLSQDHLAKAASALAKSRRPAKG